MKTAPPAVGHGEALRLVGLLLLTGCATFPPRGQDDAAAVLVPFGADDATMPLIVTDVVHPCGADERRHLELVHLPTGQVRWSAPGWQAVVGRTAQGTLLVSTEDAARATALELGVLEAFEGRLRGRCAVSLPFMAGPVEWHQPRPGVVQGLAKPKHFPSGTPLPRDDRTAAVEVRFGDWGCEVVRAPAAEGPPVPALAPWDAHPRGLTLSFPNPGPLDADRFLEAHRDGALAWRRRLGPYERQPCLVP